MELKGLTKKIESRIRYREPMKLHTSWKIGGPADFFISLVREEDLKYIINFARDSNTSLFVFGRGTNLLVKDRGIRGITVSLAKDFDSFIIKDNVIIAKGGVSLPRLVKGAAKGGLSGLEFAAGIPGSLAGALFMNAGAHGGSISEVFLKAKGINFAGEIIEYLPGDISFSYRDTSLAKEKVIITEVQLKLVPGNKDIIQDRLSNYLTQRSEVQPKGASAGSVFKNPPKDSAGRLIEETGLKGLIIGGAQISDKHANFIINNSNATAEDVLALMNRAKKEVLLNFGVSLEPEVRIVGM